MNVEKYLVIAPEVQEALAGRKPVVALESTIICHGFSYPDNLACARACEQSIRDCGAVPATVAILAGKIHVGLTDAEICHLAETKGITKCSRRDVAAVLAAGIDGATTVTTTMMFSAMAGVKVFATGGIGGVHRGAQQTFDISADLQELAQTDVAVVCAGAKAILDLRLTREYLETFGVPVLGYQTNELPGFYTRTTGETVDYRFDTPREIAEVLKVKEDMGLKGGVLITNPIPEKDSMDPVYMSEQIDKALQEAEEKHVTGKDVTPFLLARMSEITGGRSVEANKALVTNNARLAAKIAGEYMKL